MPVPSLRLVMVGAAIALLAFACKKETPSNNSTEKFRPAFHITPDSGWMNDPNGMVYYNGEYHLFYQYYPDSNRWGPMHWGHAVSKNLAQWERLPVALYPDSLGYIFSGSAVIDTDNTSGFGASGIIPLVAIFTYHDPVKADSGAVDFQYQGIATSMDNGRTWKKYEKNPVLKNPGVRDFRDPKVIWYEPGKKWIMALAVQDHIAFYSSSNLKDWKHESDFGKDMGAHGGVWECPDLLPIKVEGDSIDTTWVLFVSINPGGPNKGSATQYFVGDFDGTTFSTNQQDTKWFDYGTDNYAGVTWFGTGERKIFIGWMSNWLYGQEVPTQTWRSAMTVPRQVGLKKSNGQYALTGFPIAELDALRTNRQTGDLDKFKLAETAWLHMTLKTDREEDGIILSNEKGEKVVIGWSPEKSTFYIDRSESGDTKFSPQFNSRMEAPLLVSANLELDILIDHGSIEVFVNKGEIQMTALVFPITPYTRVSKLKKSESPEQGELSEIKSIW